MINAKEINNFEKEVEQKTYNIITEMYNELNNIIISLSEDFNSNVFYLNTNGLKDESSIVNELIKLICKTMDEYLVLDINSKIFLNGEHIDTTHQMLSRIIDRLFSEDDSMVNIVEKNCIKIQLMIEDEVDYLFNKIKIRKFGLLNKDITMLQFRINRIRKSISNTLEFFKKDIREEFFDLFNDRKFQLNNSTAKYISSLNDILHLNLEVSKEFTFQNNLNDINNLILKLKELKEVNITTNEIRTLNNIGNSLVSNEKIFSYKEMEKLALANNFEYKWSNGSHRIYSNKDTNKIVVIPSHDLGLGLSKKIQKQIINNRM